MVVIVVVVEVFVLGLECNNGMTEKEGNTLPNTVVPPSPLPQEDEQKDMQRLLLKLYVVGADSSSPPPSPSISEVLLAVWWCWRSSPSSFSSAITTLLGLLRLLLRGSRLKNPTEDPIRRCVGYGSETGTERGKPPDSPSEGGRQKEGEYGDGIEDEIFLAETLRREAMEVLQCFEDF